MRPRLEPITHDLEAAFREIEAMAQAACLRRSRSMFTTFELNKGSAFFNKDFLMSQNSKSNDTLRRGAG